MWHFLNLSDALTTEREQHGAGSGAGAAVNYRFVPGKVHSTKGHNLKWLLVGSAESIHQVELSGGGRGAQVPVCIRKYGIKIKINGFYPFLAALSQEQSWGSHSGWEGAEVK